MPLLHERGYYVILGSRLKRLRERRGIRQREVAAYLKCDQTVVSKYENGGRLLDVYELIDVCGYFGITLDQVLLPTMGAWEEKIFEQGYVDRRRDRPPRDDPWVDRVEKERKKRQKQ